MKELGRWQIVSFFSRGLAMVIGLVQSFLIIRLLSVGEWGTIQLAVSIGSALGIYQHLGLASASTREISSAKDDQQVFKIFITSAVIRYLVSIPIALLLFIFADKIAVGAYHNALLTMPLKIYAISLVFIGVQSILNAVISGTKRFKRLFIYQVLVSLINFLIFVPLVYKYKIDGYFWAFLIFNIVNSASLMYLAFSPLKIKFELPSRVDFILLFKEIFSFSMAIYLVKIIATNWEKLGPNVLGLYYSPEVIGIFAFAMLYSKKILSVSDAVTDVTLPVFSEKFKNDIQDFKTSFLSNFNKVFAFMILASTFACFWAPQLILVLVGDQKYQASYKLIPIILLAFVMYGLIDVIKSSIYVPAKLVKDMILSFVVLIFVSAFSFLFFSVRFGDPLISMACALAVGALASLFFISLNLSKKLELKVFTVGHWLVILTSTLIGWFGVNSQIVSKAIYFPVLFPGLFLLIYTFGYFKKR